MTSPETIEAAKETIKKLTGIKPASIQIKPNNLLLPPSFQPPRDQRTNLVAAGIMWRRDEAGVHLTSISHESGQSLIERLSTLDVSKVPHVCGTPHIC